MSAIHRQKACIACAASKRSCDKQLPECQRCLDRDVDCVYPQRKRRRGNPSADMDSSNSKQAPEPATASSYAGASTLENSLDFGDWSTLGPADLDMALTDVVLPYIPALDIRVAGPADQRLALDGDNASSAACPWFLREETWTVQHSKAEDKCAVDIELPPYIRAVEEMLQSWVRHGHSMFIHRRLYEKGMPTCVQDAFTILAAYTARTPAVKETILQIAEERAIALIRQSAPPSNDGPPAILAHLARVHALFVYQFIRLFDGSVRLRASAERQNVTIRQWLIQLREVARRYRGERGSSSGLRQRFNSAVNEFEDKYAAQSEMWKQWILIESVRRTLLIVDTIVNTYEAMNKGWAECSGAILFSAIQGLWDAESAVKWVELCSAAKAPLLISPIDPEPLMASFAAEDFDDFAKLAWTMIIGNEKLRYWIDSSNSTSKTRIT